MSITKTLGGDRLGSGKKQKVEMHGYERSTHDLGYLWRSTMSPGTLVPFMCKVALPGDTWDIDLNANIMTHPTIGPLFGSYKVQLDVFQAPIRLYNALLHNNALGIGMKISNVKFPVLKLTPTDVSESLDIDNSQINPSAILSYLGIRGVGIPGAVPVDREFNAIPYLAYVEIYKQYYSNKQEELGAVIHTPIETVDPNVVEVLIQDKDDNTLFLTLDDSPLGNYISVSPGLIMKIAVSGTALNPAQIYFDTSLGAKNLLEIADELSYLGGYNYYQMKTTNGFFLIENWRYIEAADGGPKEPKVVTFPLENIDTMRENILGFNSKVTAFDVKAQNLEPYKWIFEQPFGVPTLMSSQEGLLVKTYQSDLFQNWLQTEWIDGAEGISAMSAIDVSDGTLTMDAINLAKKVYEMLTRIAVSGGTYDNWLEVQYDHDNITRAESPIYEGGLSKELVFQEVVSNAAAGDQDLGTLAGKGVMSKKHKGGQIVIRVNEPSYIIGLISLTPRIDYSQGNSWDVHLKTMADLHVPALDQIGFQESLLEERAWWDTTWDSVTGKWIQRSAGKVPAWINYMTSVNEVRGNFAIADNEMFMTLNRRYEANYNGTIKDLTTYIDPVKFNFIFADSAIDAQNFWAQVSVDATVRRKMSAKVMPNI